MLKLDDVSKVYKVGTFGGKELHAVRDVCFDVQDGEVVSLIGESGSGKSTIGKMILRLVSITSGSIVFDGLDIAGLRGPALKDYYRRVQGVFQDPFSSYNPIFKADRTFRIIRDEFFPDVALPVWNDKVDGSLRAVGLNPPDVLNKFPHQLSGGQLQRFLIARALLLDVRFLVADEIISMLDASTRIDVLNLLAGLKARGLSILFITHDLSLGYYISERAVMLYRGCVVEMGPTEKVFFNPLHPYTQTLMACVPSLHEKWKKTGAEPGEIPSEVTTGCAYYNRCPVTQKDGCCTSARPPLIEREAGHYVACCYAQGG
ncbi:MAG: ABC transporter ATP-binding protein [Chloroflexi bacterium]|nr:ABC transporter ATP-binding protein [Chloroflexota bacterium]